MVCVRVCQAENRNKDFSNPRLVSLSDWSAFSPRRGSGWRPSWTSARSTTKGRAPAWRRWALRGPVFQGYWAMVWGRGRRRTTSWEGRPPQPLSACCRNRERATRRTWRRSAVVQRAPIRRWGHLLLPAQHQHCTMETDRSEGMLISRPLCMPLWKQHVQAMCSALLNQASLKRASGASVWSWRKFWVCLLVISQCIFTSATFTKGCSISHTDPSDMWSE